MLFLYPFHNSLMSSCGMALLCFVWSLGLQSVNSQQILRPHTQLYSKSLQVIKQQLVPQLWPCHTHVSMCVEGTCVGDMYPPKWLLQHASRIFSARHSPKRWKRKFVSTFNTTCLFWCLLHVLPAKKSELISRNFYLPSGYDRYDIK